MSTSKKGTKDIIVDNVFVTIKKGSVIVVEGKTGIVKKAFTVFIGTGGGDHPITLEKV